VITAAVSGPSAMWYLTRGTAAIALLLLTLSVALGVVNVSRSRTADVPRFVFQAVHRSSSLLPLAFVLVHVATSLLDGFAPIRLIDVIVPFTSAYRPLWLGFGAVAFDVLIAVAVTSLVRRHIGYRGWRATHWAAYACWPVALVHGLGTGTDTRTTWMLAITAGCVIVIVAAVAVRATDGWPKHSGVRAAALAACVLVPLALLAWLPIGPLAPGWAKRAGTPSSLLATAATLASSGSAGSTGGGSPPSFTAQVSGAVRQGSVDEGRSEVHLSLAIAGQRLSVLGIRILGRPADGGGVEMTTSRAQLGTRADPSMYRGGVTSLQGTNIGATVRDSSGSQLGVVVNLQVDPQSGMASGTVTVGPAVSR